MYIIKQLKEKFCILNYYSGLPFLEECPPFTLSLTNKTRLILCKFATQFGTKIKADWLTRPDLHAIFNSPRAEGNAFEIFYTRVRMDNACKSGRVNQ